MDTSAIRNIVLVGHAGSGKTSLAEALLHRAGATTRLGRVDDGTSLLDSEPEEIRRRITLATAVAPVEWTTARGRTYKINLVDTPGHAEFGAAVEAGLAVADLAVVVVSAVEGIQPGDERVWARCRELGLPRFIFITKEDKPSADFESVLADVRGRLGRACLPVELPVGEQDRFRAVLDLISERMHGPGPDGHDGEEPVPAEVADDERRRHDELVEEVVSEDDEQMERYLAGEQLTPDELLATLAREVADGIVFPTLVGSAATGVGVEHLAELVCTVGPAPRPTTVLVDGEPTPVVPDPAGEPLVHVFRTMADPFVGQLSLLKVLSGTLRNEDQLVNTTTGTEERVRGLFHLRGKEHLPTGAVVAGDIVAVAKLAGSPSHSLLALPGRPVSLPPREAAEAGYTQAVRPLTQADDDRLVDALRRLCAEDPSLSFTQDEESGQTLLTAVGDTHIAVSLERLERKFGVHVETREVQIPYRETICRPVEVEGKVKKQSGGHGQFALVRLRVEPAERGTGLTFVNEVVGGAIPRNYIPAVEKGVVDAMASGGPHGYRVTDLRVACVDGKHHSVDSSDMAFRTAAAQAISEALRQGGVDVLEPVAHVRAVVPTETQGDVLSDLSARRGRVVDTGSGGDGLEIVEALVPEAELRRYAVELRAMTGGRGRYQARTDHYEVVPEHLAARLADAVDAAR